MGFHLKVKIFHRHVGREKRTSSADRKSLSLHNQPDCFLCLRVLAAKLQVSVSSLFSTWLYSSSTKTLCTLKILPAMQAKNAPSPKFAQNNALSLINLSSCCCPLLKDQLTLPTAHEGKKSTWMTETLANLYPRPHHLQRLQKNKNTLIQYNINLLLHSCTYT